MSMIRLSIDTKSLFFNIKNDNECGHTATVATPLKQGSVARPELFEIEKIPEGINCFSKEDLVSQILSKSRASAKINRVCVFEKIAVNGTELKDLPAFCMYIREETDPSNVHFGRQKLHYPMSLSFEDLNVDINNRAVLKAAHLSGYKNVIVPMVRSTRKTGCEDYARVLYNVLFSSDLTGWFDSVDIICRNQNSYRVFMEVFS